MSSKTLKPVVLAAGAVVLGALAGSAFAMTPLSQGYQVPGDQPQAQDGAAAADGKAEEEGKCGEGQCGADKMEATSGDGGAAAEDADGKAEGEGKCGEGSCGEDKHGDE